MYVLSQDSKTISNITGNVFKKSVSLNTPLKRVYEIQTEKNFTGLEEEGIALLRGKIKEPLAEVSIFIFLTKEMPKTNIRNFSKEQNESNFNYLRL